MRSSGLRPRGDGTVHVGAIEAARWGISGVASAQDFIAAARGIGHRARHRIGKGRRRSLVSCWATIVPATTVQRSNYTDPTRKGQPPEPGKEPGFVKRRGLRDRAGSAIAHDERWRRKLDRRRTAVVIGKAGDSSRSSARGARVRYHRQRVTARDRQVRPPPQGVTVELGRGKDFVARH